MAAENQSFEDFCQGERLEQHTVSELQGQGIDSVDDFKLLTETEIDNTFSHLVFMQRKLLKTVVKKLNEGPAEQAGTAGLIRTEPDEDITKDDYRLVLLGTTGSGKSCTGNTILGEQWFATDGGFGAVTRKCEMRRTQLNGKIVRVVDTPGINDPHRNKDEVKSEAMGCLELSEPGPHAFLYVINPLEREVTDYLESYQRLRRQFKSNINRYTILVFSHGDKVKKKGKKIEDIVKNEKAKGRSKSFLASILTEVDDRYVVMCNNGDQATKDENVLTLLQEIAHLKDQNLSQPCFQDPESLRQFKETKKKIDDYRKWNTGSSREEAFRAIQPKALIAIGAVALALVYGVIRFSR